jgi:hypothetical protein
VVAASGDLWGELIILICPATSQKRSSGFDGEYVNRLLRRAEDGLSGAAKNAEYLKDCYLSKDAGVVNQLLMEDDEGPLASAIVTREWAAIESHLNDRAAKVPDARPSA